MSQTWLPPAQMLFARAGVGSMTSPGQESPGPSCWTKVLLLKGCCLWLAHKEPSSNGCLYHRGWPLSYLAATSIKSQVSVSCCIKASQVSLAGNEGEDEQGTGSSCRAQDFSEPLVFSELLVLKRETTETPGSHSFYLSKRLHSSKHPGQVMMI